MRKRDLGKFPDEEARGLRRETPGTEHLTILVKTSVVFLEPFPLVGTVSFCLPFWSGIQTQHKVDSQASEDPGLARLRPHLLFTGV